MAASALNWRLEQLEGVGQRTRQSAIPSHASNGMCSQDLVSPEPTCCAATLCFRLPAFHLAGHATL
eukprot:15465203-Alexandrium_andersonii.AAC.1